MIVWCGRCDREPVELPDNNIRAHMHSTDRRPYCPPCLLSVIMVPTQPFTWTPHHDPPNPLTDDSRFTVRYRPLTRAERNAMTDDEYRSLRYTPEPDDNPTTIGIPFFAGDPPRVVGHVHPPTDPDGTYTIQPLPDICPHDDLRCACAAGKGHHAPTYPPDSDPWGGGMIGDVIANSPMLQRFRDIT